MHNFAWIFLEIIFAMLQGGCLQYFYGNFLENRMQKRRLTGICVAVLYGAWTVGMNVFLPFDYSGIRTVERQALGMGILFVAAACFYKWNHALAVFLAVTFKAVSGISDFLAYSAAQPCGGLFHFWNWCFGKGYFSENAFEILVKITSFAIPVLEYAVSLLLLFVSLRSINRNFREKGYAIHKTEILFIMIPGLTGWLICVLLRMIFVITEHGEPSGLLYDSYPALNLIVPVIMLLSLLSVLYGVKLFQKLIDFSREKNNRIIFEKQISGMQEHIGEMERVHAGIRSMKHDMKNTLLIIRQLSFQNGAKEHEELQAYLSGLYQTMDSLELQFQTGNTVVDVLLNMKYHEMIRVMPDLQMNADGLLFPDTLFIQSYDLGIILGNALDNAMEACRKLKSKEPKAETFIRIASFQDGKLLFLKMENSFDGTLIQKPQTDFPATDKEDKAVHGMGLANIRRAAEKYQGVADWKADGTVFILSIMMKNEKNN